MASVSEKTSKQREKAAAEKGVLELRAMQDKSGIRYTTTFLADADLRQAEDAFRRLEGRSRTLLEYLDYALTNYREPGKQKLSTEAAAEYYATKNLAHDRTLLSMRQLRSIENELNALKRRFWLPTLAKPRWRRRSAPSYIRTDDDSLESVFIEAGNIRSI